MMVSVSIFMDGVIKLCVVQCWLWEWCRSLSILWILLRRGHRTILVDLLFFWLWRWVVLWLPFLIFLCYWCICVLVFWRTNRIFFRTLPGRYLFLRWVVVCRVRCTNYIFNWVRSRLSFFLVVLSCRLFWCRCGGGLIFLSSTLINITIKIR